MLTLILAAALSHTPVATPIATPPPAPVERTEPAPAGAGFSSADTSRDASANLACAGAAASGESFTSLPGQPLRKAAHVAAAPVRFVAQRRPIRSAWQARPRLLGRIFRGRR